MVVSGVLNHLKFPDSFNIFVFTISLLASSMISTFGYYRANGSNKNKTKFPIYFVKKA